MNEKEKEELKESINLMYNNHISQYGKRKLENYINMILDLYNQEKEKNKKLEEENKYLQDYLDGMEGGLKEQIKEQSREMAELQERLQES